MCSVFNKDGVESTQCQVFQIGCCFCLAKADVDSTHLQCLWVLFAGYSYRKTWYNPIKWVHSDQTFSNLPYPEKTISTKLSRTNFDQ